MSILIEGMKMPKDCKDCIFCVNNWCVINSRLHHIKGAEETTQYCPLIPVPPHGDLIDRRKLPLAFIDITDLPTDRCLPVYLQEDVDDAPTIIESEGE